MWVAAGLATALTRLSAALGWARWLGERQLATALERLSAALGGARWLGGQQLAVVTGSATAGAPQ